MNTEPAYILQRRTTQRRSLGSDVEWRLLHHGEVTLTGRSTGRLFNHGAVFDHPDGRAAFTISPTRQVLPKTWVARDPDERDLVTLNISSLKRGRTSVTDHQNDRILTLQSVNSLLADTAKSAVLMGTERFSVIDDTHVVGEMGAPVQGERRLVAAARSLANALRSRPGPFVIAETLLIVDPAWEPSDILVCACLAFRSEVISHVRTP